MCDSRIRAFFKGCSPLRTRRYQSILHVTPQTPSKTFCSTSSGVFYRMGGTSNCTANSSAKPFRQTRSELASRSSLKGSANHATTGTTRGGLTRRASTRRSNPLMICVNGLRSALRPARTTLTTGRS